MKNHVASLDKKNRSAGKTFVRAIQAKSVPIQKRYGMRDAIGVLRMLYERNLEHGNDIYISCEFREEI